MSRPPAVSERTAAAPGRTREADGETMTARPTSQIARIDGPAAAAPALPVPALLLGDELLLLIGP